MGNFGSSGIFGKLENFGIFGTFKNLELFEILEIRKIRGENIENFGIDFGRVDCHPPDDRPCMTTHKKGHDILTAGGNVHIHRHIWRGPLYIK